MNDRQWLLEEVYTSEFNHMVKQPKTSSKIEKMKSMSLFDIAQKLNSKPDFNQMDKED